MIQDATSTIKSLKAILSVIYKGYSIVLKELKSEEAQAWTNAYYRTQFDGETVNIALDMERFWKTDDSNALMNFYYHGFPMHVLHGFSKNKLNSEALGEKDDWMLDYFYENIVGPSEKLIETVPIEKRDINRCHRLFVFPILVSLQLLPHASKATRQGFCDFIEDRLSKAINNWEWITDSLSDQICQIIPQMLIEQLLVGHISWRYLLIDSKLLDTLIKLGDNPDISRRFRSATNISLQFLVYYRASLETKLSPVYFPNEFQKQSASIDQYFSRIFDKKTDLDKTSAIWIDALEGYLSSLKLTTLITKQIFPQSSAILMARKSRSQDIKIPDKIWKLAALNNLKAAHSFISLPDSDDRRSRVLSFLSDNGITNTDGIDIVEKYIRGKGNKNFKEDMMEFVQFLPREIEPNYQITPTTIALTRESTLDDVWSSVSNYNAWSIREKGKAALDLSTDRIAHYAYKISRPALVRWVANESKMENRLQTKTDTFTKLFLKIAEEQS
ncbi:MAG: hypothetical protein JKY66_10555 [Spongiibacteraceae bacterium]|nr:hypothetical protein [Spongiibacteraceae bacterium]